MKTLILIASLLVLPIKFLAAETLKYVPLEGEAFKDFGQTSTSNLGEFLSAAFQFGLAIAAALAVVMIVWGGVEIMLSESLFKKEDGKKKVWDAIWGLLLALVSWLILYTINPQILDWSFLGKQSAAPSAQTADEYHQETIDIINNSITPESQAMFQDMYGDSTTNADPDQPIADIISGQERPLVPSNLQPEQSTLTENQKMVLFPWLED
jgi:hypothetical protein